MSEAGWELGVMVFSGRPDPSWRPAAEIVARIEQLFDSLPRLGTSVSEPPPLGYRGAFARGPGITVTACRGVAERILAGHRELRADLSRDLERLMVSSAPDAIWSERWAEVLRDEGFGP